MESPCLHTSRDRPINNEPTPQYDSIIIGAGHNGLQGVENLKPFDIGYFPFGDAELMISRTGFTGELGYELWIDPERARMTPPPDS